MMAGEKSSSFCVLLLLVLLLVLLLFVTTPYHVQSYCTGDLRKKRRKYVASAVGWCAVRYYNSE